MVKPEVIARLVADENGVTGLMTPMGRVDVVTPTHLIVVERIQHWRMAIENAVALKSFFPQLDARVHLFGSSPSVSLPVVQAYALEKGVMFSVEAS